MSRKPLAVDELLSYAVRTGDDVRVHVTMPTADVAPGAITLRLRSGRRVVDFPAELTTSEGGLVLDSTVTVERSRRVWRLVLRLGPDATPMPLQARLLSPQDQPVALLPGPVPTTSMAPPPQRTPVTPVRRLARRLPEPVKSSLRRGRTLLAQRTSS